MVDAGESSSGLSPSHPKASHVSHPILGKSLLYAPNKERKLEGSRDHSNILCVLPPFGRSPQRSHSAQHFSSFTRLIFFSSSLLADMMEEEPGCSSTSQPPHNRTLGPSNCPVHLTSLGKGRVTTSLFAEQLRSQCQASDAGLECYQLWVCLNGSYEVPEP